jgi:hydroxypyruvate isomerase
MLSKRLKDSIELIDHSLTPSEGVRMNTAVAWWCLVPEKMTPDAFIGAAVDLGYTGIELAPEDRWSQIREAGLNLATIRGHDSLTDGLNRRENHDRIEREINENLALAQEWSVPALICFSGNRGGLDDEDGATNTADGLKRVAKAAEDAGVTLVLELLNSKINHSDYQCDRTEWGVKVCDWVDSPRVKLLYDIYHMQIMEGDLIRTIEKHHRSIGHYHVAGNPGRHEPDESQEINYPAVYRAIKATGYAGYVGMEFVPEQDAVESLRNAIAVVP